MKDKAILKTNKRGEILVKKLMNLLRSHSFAFSLALIGVLALAMGAALMSLGVGSSSNAVPSPTAPTDRIVMFSEKGELDTFLSDNTAAASGFTVVHSSADLTNAINGSTESVVFTSGTQNLVNSEWLRNLYKQDVVIVGVNVPKLKLADMVGDTDVLPSDTYNPPGIFASWAFRVDCSGGGSKGLGVFPIVSSSDFTKMLNTMIVHYRTVCDQFNATSNQ